MELMSDKAYLLTVEGNVTEIHPENEKTFALEEVQRLVDGYIEVVRLTSDQIMIVNEEGKFCKKYNPIASGIADLHHALRNEDYISGDAVICPSPMLP